MTKLNNRKSNKRNYTQPLWQNNHRHHHGITTALNIPELSMKARTAFHFNDEVEQPLLSIPLLADDGCKIDLTKYNIVVTKNDKIILKEIRDKVSTLWMIPVKHHKKVNLLAHTTTTVPTTSTCGKQRLPPINYCKINGIP
jgi:hypothetical protein